MQVTFKINGAEIHVETDKMHETWINRCLEYGVRRLVNDTFSAEKGNVKFDLCRSMAAEMQSGKPIAEKVSRAKVDSDPVTSLAVKTAKQDLLAIFKKLTSCAKIEDMAKHEKIAPYFAEVGGKLAWADDKVLAYIGKQKESGKRDYMADAQTALNGADDLDI